MSIQIGRHTAQIEGDFVLFLIGVRINRPWLVHKWLPIVLAMPRMLTELKRRPDLGLLHAGSFISGLTIQMVQYWRSFEQLHRNARGSPLSLSTAIDDGQRTVVERVLPYRDGRCVFRGEDDRCAIYEDRPINCRRFQCIRYYHLNGFDLSRHEEFLHFNPRVLNVLESV